MLSRSQISCIAFGLVLSGAVIAQTPDSAPSVASSAVPSAPSTPGGSGDQVKPAEPVPPAAPAPLPTPAITGPLSQLPPSTFDAGPLGTIAVNAMVTGSAMATGNYVAGDDMAHGALSNGQIFLQKTDGWFQFFVQAGAYNITSLGVPFMSTEDNMTQLFGPVPVAFAKLVPGKNTSILIGALPTLIGAEYTFSFENMNIQRGLLWGQENAVNRGIQVNQTMGKFTASISWNDGFYSNRYTWITGSLAYTNGAHSLAFVAGGNAGQTAFSSFATPIQNNSSIYNVIYTFNKNGWIVQPYWQYTNVPTNLKIGVTKGASTNGGAILLSKTFKHGLSLPIRYEYISSSGSADQGSVNLLYGPGSSGTSFTVTPTWQKGGLFVRGEMGWAHAMNYAPGSVFGRDGMDANQPRAMVEFGFIFGNNITEHKATP